MPGSPCRFRVPDGRMDSPLAKEHSQTPSLRAATAELKLAMVTDRRGRAERERVREERVMAAGLRSRSLVAVGQSMYGARGPRPSHACACSSSLNSPDSSLSLPCTHVLRTTRTATAYARTPHTHVQGRRKSLQLCGRRQRQAGRRYGGGGAAQAGRRKGSRAVKMKRWFLCCCCRSRKKNQSN